MTLSEFISLDIKYHSHREKIFETFIQTLSKLPENNFSYQESLLLKSYCGKFFDAIREKRYFEDEEREKYFKIVEEFIALIRKKEYIQSSSKILRIILPTLNLNRLKFQIEDNFEKVLNMSVNLINRSKEFDDLHDHLRIGEFYNPKNSNKEQIKKLLLESIDLLEQDETLKKKSKKRIIDFIKKAIDELENEHTNWTEFLGKLKEVVIVLAAIGSIASGASVFAAKQKVEEATNVVYQTSITINYKSISDTFNINNAPQLKHFNNILQLEENNIVDIDKEK